MIGEEVEKKYNEVNLFPLRCFSFQASDSLVNDTLEKAKKICTNKKLLALMNKL